MIMSLIRDYLSLQLHYDMNMIVISKVHQVSSRVRLVCMLLIYHTYEPALLNTNLEWLSHFVTKMFQSRTMITIFSRDLVFSPSEPSIDPHFLSLVLTVEREDVKSELSAYSGYSPEYDIQHLLKSRIQFY